MQKMNRMPGSAMKHMPMHRKSTYLRFREA